MKTIASALIALSILAAIAAPPASADQAWSSWAKDAFAGSHPSS
jgi:hypothetical protein